MLSVTQLAQFLLHLDPSKSSPRLAFYNYLKNWLIPQTPFTQDHVDEFFDRCLTFDYWQSHKKQLGEQVFEDIRLFFEQHQTPLFDLKSLTPPELRQVVRLNSYSDLEALTLEEMNIRKEVGDQIRLIRLNDNQILALRLLGKGGLEVLSYRNEVRIHKGKLRLSPPITKLSYSPMLDLNQHQSQLLEGPTLSNFAFEVTEAGIKGILTRGYSFQKAESFSNLQLGAHAELFYALKRVERYFVKPQSDPFYQELIALLEKAYQLISAGEPQSEQMAATALSKGRLAYKNIFPGDKLLLLLITNIEYWLIQRKSQKGPSPSPWPHSPNN